MRQFKMLILTDHSNHSSENSLYLLAKAMRQHPRCQQVDVASRGIAQNDFFFKDQIVKPLFVTKVGEDFGYDAAGSFLKNGLRQAKIQDYDVIWLRMPPPLSSEFLHFLIQSYPDQLIINAPMGIYETGSKEFLANFPELCPPMKICRSIEDIVEFKKNFPIVLKPFREYGGKGIIRVEGDKVLEGSEETSFEDFKEQLKDSPLEYLGVKFLKNVSQGDKRIVVVAGEIMGASLRLPAKDSWMCNVAMGGTSTPAEVDKDEIAIVKRINPVLAEMGIIMYGVDTLMGDEGKRILSEINTTSIGGLPQIAAQTGKPLLERTADLMWDYIVTKTKENVVSNK
nr:glutathione synthetase [uncultured bacterium]